MGVTKGFVQSFSRAGRRSTKEALKTLGKKGKISAGKRMIAPAVGSVVGTGVGSIAGGRAGVFAGSHAAGEVSKLLTSGSKRALRKASRLRAGQAAGDAVKVVGATGAAVGAKKLTVSEAKKKKRKKEMEDQEKEGSAPTVMDYFFDELEKIAFSLGEMRGD